MAGARVVLRVQADLATRVKAEAERRGVTIAEAADNVVAAGLVANGRSAPKLSVSPDVLAAARIYADERGMTVRDALDKLVTSGLHRLAALAKYAKKQCAEAPQAAGEVPGA